jgi:5'-3' exonuclease
MLNSIQKLKSKHRPNEVIICFDSISWREKFFPFYKARRKLKKKEADVDYAEFIETINEIKEDFETFFPYKIMQVKWAEADDIIGVLVKILKADRKMIVIASRDKDFKQLLGSNVKLWDTVDWAWKKVEDPKTFLIRQILSGDANDDVPNVKSDDDTFITDGKRQKACGPKTIDKILQQGIQEWVKENDLLKNYRRNKRLIQLSPVSIPEKVWNAVVETYEACEDKKPNYMVIMEYFQRNRMKRLSGLIDKFM